MEVKFEKIKIFGPSVIKAKIPNDILIKINKYVDDVIVDKQKSKDLNYGEKLVGDVTQEIRLDESRMGEVQHQTEFCRLSQYSYPLLKNVINGDHRS